MLAAAVRFAYVAFAKHGEEVNGDQIYYSAQASVIARGHFFTHPFFGGPAADHPPLTSLLLAPVDWIAPQSVFAQRLAMASFGAVTVALIGTLTRRVTRSDRAAFAAGLVAALNPNLWMNDGLVMSETFTALTVTTVLIAAYRYVDDPTRKNAAFAGVALGVAMLARAEIVILGGFLLLAIGWIRRADKKQVALGAVVAAGAALLAIAPWVAFNLARFERPTLLSNGDGLLLAGANCDATFYGGGIGFWSLECADQRDPEARDQSDTNALQRRVALNYLKSHKGRLPVVMAAREGRLWGVYHPGRMIDFNQGEGRERWASLLGVLTYWLLWPATIVGTVMVRRTNRPVSPLIATFAYAAVVAALFYGIFRFRLPADVAMTVLGGIALARLPLGMFRGHAR